MRHLIQQGKRLTGRALAAYATYEAGKKTFDKIAAAELDRLFRWFYEMDPPTPAPAHTRSAGLSPAQVAETFKQHLDAPQNGWEAVLNLIPTPTQQGAALRVA